MAAAARHTVNRGYQQLIAARLDRATRTRIDALFARTPGVSRSAWDTVKREPKRPTTRQMKEVLERLHWLQALDVSSAVFSEMPTNKLQQFATEAKTLDASDMHLLTPHKRYALAATLIQVQAAKALDDLAEMFVRRVQKLHQKGQQALAQYRNDQSAQTDTLIALFSDVVTAYMEDGTKEERFDAIAVILGEHPQEFLDRCEEHRTYAGNTYVPFLPRFYRSPRSVLLRFLESVPLRSTSQDRALEKAIAFLLEYRHLKGPRLDGIRRLDLSWIPHQWWRFVTGEGEQKRLITEVDRRYFELCLFTQIVLDLKSGDLCVPGSGVFSDYRDQLISWEDYEQGVDEYGEQVGLPVESKAFVQSLRTWLESVAAATDASFPNNAHARIEDGEVILHRLERTPTPEGLRTIETLLRERLPEINIVDVLSETEHWLQWTHFFRPLSGFAAKIASPRARYVTTTFCYGCNLGPVQTARSVSGIDRRQLAWVNHRHVTEEYLDKAIISVSNAYNRFTLPRFWGSGKHASADGTKWDVYEQNLLAEYHLRYGGWGGIGYYHVSDLYIALFSHFIPCRVWEGIYILDGVANNPSEIQPDILHADTQGQSAPIFGLAHLLGIKLMPRIRNWQDLKLFRPTRYSRYDHIDELFTDSIDWELIDTFLPDLLRIALSIKAGRITPSTILRRLGTYSRKNRLYLAMRELGYAVRTGFLLQYLSDIDLRKTIHGATNKSEAFNQFTKWLFCGGEGVIGENDRDAQRKIVKYNHLVANLLIFHNVVRMTKIIRELLAEGYPITDTVLAALSPYQTAHVNRFGQYTLDLDREPGPIEYEVSLHIGHQAPA